MRSHYFGVTGAVITSLTLLAVPVSASALPAGTAVADARILVHFSLASGQQPENIALEPGGAADLTFALIGQVVRVTRHGDVEPLATLPPAPAGAGAPILGAPFTGGIVRAPNGTVFVNYSTGTADLTGVWALRQGSAPVRVAALPPSSLANGLARAPDGTMYVADSALGVIWRVPAGGGTPTVWASGPQLAPSGFLGANGIKAGQGSVWVTNTDQGTLLRIPVGPGGAAGHIQTVAAGLAGIDDFALTRGGQFLAAINTTSQLALINPDGTHAIVLTAADGLSNPTSVAVAGRIVYVPSAAYFTQNDPNLLLASLTP